ncbi:matrixin family metalloprotease [Verrucomicrobiaceae bacterium 5K15]|uniref:Matrixin family metalloprotease n=1 Tax=Oceaniferula flava TaxID=2800421 RepID=A0AAE2VD90_9BACT|nr:matrixin family metalloprotease [Oceaniferula flavus]MBK1854294.1 matrixin family metalloprotease [Oceaniferula flavus]MBM1135600.1 matrixin family metalloprotease [Oceaniferula flavus]
MKRLYLFAGVTALSTTAWYFYNAAGDDHPPQAGHTPDHVHHAPCDHPSHSKEIPQVGHHSCKGCSHDRQEELAVAQVLADQRKSSWPHAVLEHLEKSYQVSAQTLRHLSRSVSYTEFEQLTEEQLERVVKYTEFVQNHEADELVHLCWAVETDPMFASAMDTVRALAIEEGESEEPLPVFQGDDRWSYTATDGNVGSTGSPVTITWGFVADGTDIESTSSFSGGTSDLIATLNATFGASTTSSYEDAPWFELFESAFTYWAEVTGNTYVYVDYDDGIEINGRSSSRNTYRGVIGVRPDVRIGGTTLDGTSNTLAYNYFPDAGDMVIDTDDSLNFNNSSTTKKRFRNVIAHEHGHGLGLSHVCPVDRSKLMEPSVTTNFVGVQFDDMITVQGLYGDKLERSASSTTNDSTSTAYDLGSLPANLEREELSISVSGDVDIYQFSISSAKKLSLRLTPTNQAAYLEGEQLSSGCSSGTSFDPSVRQDLAVRILASNGSTVLATADATAIGGEEVINNLALTQTGQPHFIEVTGGGENSADNNNAQIYSLVVETEDLPNLSVASSDGVAKESDVADTGSFTITSSIAPSSDLDIAYTVSGSASSGSDFIALAGTATIDSGETSTAVSVKAISDSIVEGDETVIMTLASTNDYAITTGTASITIEDLLFDDWRHTNFGNATENIGESEDFDFDGLQNLLEYALGEDPTELTSDRPTASLENGGTQLVLTYQVDTTLSDIQYIVEVSPTLGDSENPWTSTGVTLQNGAIVDGKRTVTATVSVTAERQFMRLRVVRN